MEIRAITIYETGPLGCCRAKTNGSPVAAGAVIGRAGAPKGLGRGPAGYRLFPGAARLDEPAPDSPSAGARGR